MDYLTKVYKEKCKKEFFELGFKYYRRNFYRVINDMFQSFQLHKSVSGSGCTVEFVVVPLCLGNCIQKTYCGSDHIKMFERDYSWFKYDRGSKESMDKCIDEMIGYIKKYLIPYFQLSDNSEKAYFSTCDFQKNNYKEGIFMADPCLFGMALKAKFYDKAIVHLSARKEHAENAYKTNMEHFSGLDVEYKASMKKMIKEISHQIKMISEHNLKYIQEYIDENEEKALVNLGIK